LVVWLHPPNEIEQCFPNRLRELREGFASFLRRLEGTDIASAQSKVIGIAVQGPINSSSLAQLERRLAKRAFRPLSFKEAAQFLGVDKKELRRLRHCGEIKPSGYEVASRYGRNYSYPMFSVNDLIRIQSERSSTL
jgi:hypothetical protein